MLGTRKKDKKNTLFDSQNIFDGEVTNRACAHGIRICPPAQLIVSAGCVAAYIQLCGKCPRVIEQSEPKCVCDREKNVRFHVDYRQNQMKMVCE